MAQMITKMKATLGAPHHYASRTKHTVKDQHGSRDFPPFVCLEIVQDPRAESCYLFHISEDGQIADTWHETIADAIDQAEWELGVRPDEWQSVTDEKKSL